MASEDFNNQKQNRIELLTVNNEQLKGTLQSRMQ